jgi:hypothetical protein
MDRNNASNTQSSAGGKTNVIMQGQTSDGAYGSEENAKRRVTTDPTELTPN